MSVSRSRKTPGISTESYFSNSILQGVSKYMSYDSKVTIVQGGPKKIYHFYKQKL